MAFNEKLPKWDNVGVEPPESKKTEGWQPTEKPPAQWFNWIFNRIYKSLIEIRSKAVEKEEISSQGLNKGASLIGINDIDNKFTATNVEGALKELFTNVSDGKQVVATAITGKGVSTSGSDTFSKMATNIGAIETDPSIGTTNAVASDLLATKKAISKGVLITGTMPSVALQNILLTKQNEEFLIPKGYFDTGSKVKVTMANLIPANVKKDVNIGDIIGTFIGAIETDKTGDATALASDILAPKTAYSKGVKLVGTIPSKGTQTYTPSITAQLIEAGQYLSGRQTIAAVQVPVANVLAGTTIAGQAGTMVNRGAVSNTITTQFGQFTIPQGYHNGVGKVTAYFVNLVEGNVKSGVNIGGVIGNFNGNILSGESIVVNDALYSNRYIKVTLPFKPKFIQIVKKLNSTTQVLWLDNGLASVDLGNPNCRMRYNSSGYSISGDITNLVPSFGEYVNGTGFRLIVSPGFSEGETASWVAFD